MVKIGSLQYRAAEADVALNYLSKPNIDTKSKIGIIEAIQDKTHRVLYRSKLLPPDQYSDFRGLIRTHLNSLKKVLRILSPTKFFIPEGITDSELPELEEYIVQAKETIQKLSLTYHLMC